MFSKLRLRLTLLYLGAGVALLGLLGSGTYWLVAEYFRTTTDAGSTPLKCGHVATPAGGCAGPFGGRPRRFGATQAGGGT